MIIRMWIVTGLQGFSGFVDDLGQDNEVKLEIICTIKPCWWWWRYVSNIGDDGDDGKENDGYFASPSVLLYDYNNEETVKVGDDGIDDAGDEEEEGDIEISNPGLAQRSGAMVMVAGTRLGRGQLAFHQLVMLSFRKE